MFRLVEEAGDLKGSGLSEGASAHQPGRSKGRAKCWQKRECMEKEQFSFCLAGEERPANKVQDYNDSVNI